MIVLPFHHRHRRSLSASVYLAVHCFCRLSVANSYSTLINDNTSNGNMLLRVRSNVGTWKLNVPKPESTCVRELIRTHETFQSWKVIQPLSWDPSGKKLLEMQKSLQEQGLHHGSMVYCRVEAAGAATEGPVSSDVAAKQPVNQRHHNDQKEVVELLDSSDDEQESRPSGSSRKRYGSGLKGAFTNTNVENQDVIVLDDDSEDNASVNLLASSDDERKSAAKKKKKKATTKRSPTKTATRTDPPTRKRVKTSASAATSSATMPSTLSSSTDGDDGPKKFQMVSYNIWFGPPDPTANQVHPEQRMGAIVRAINNVNRDPKTNPMLFMGFQEVTTSLRAYLNPALNRLGYRFCTQPNLGDFYGVALAIPNDLDVLESKFVPFSESTQGRGLLYVRTKHLLFGTCHLESFVDAQRYTGTSQREVQIVEAAQFCQDQLAKHSQLKMTILAGDFNWDDERKRGAGPNKLLLSLLKSSWKDAGKPFDHTYDAKENPMLGGNLRRRFDRCIYLTANNNKSDYQVSSLLKIGKSAIPGLTWNKRNPYNGTSRQVPVAPSDHFGVVVNFEKKS